MGSGFIAADGPLPAHFNLARREFDGIWADPRIRHNRAKQLARILLSEIDAVDAAIQRATVARHTDALLDAFAVKPKLLAARQTALRKLQKTFAPATYRWGTGKPPLACWSYLRCRDSNRWADDAAGPRDRQRVVSIFYLLCGKVPGGSRLMGGCWGLEITEHCISRLVSLERSPLAATPLETMMIAHRTLLRASSRAVLASKDTFLLPAADGAFVCEAQTAELACGAPVMFVLARTWIHQTHADCRVPVRMATDINDALGAFWLMPVPLRKPLGDGRFDVPDAALTELR